MSDVVLTYTDQLSAIAGVVRGTRTAGPNPEVVAFPADRNHWAQDPLNPRQPRLEQSLNDGRYRVADLLPGDYFVAAVDTADVPEVIDLPFLEAVSRFATRVTLAAGQTASPSLTVGSVR